MKAAVIQCVDAARAAALADISRAMLNYLSRENLIVASGSRGHRGTRRLYTFGDVVALRVIGKMLRSGIEVRRLKRGLNAIHDRIKNDGPEDNALRCLATDGTDLFLWNVDGTLESLTSNGQLAFGFLIDLMEPRTYLQTQWPKAIDESVDGRKTRRRAVRRVNL